MLLDAHCHVDHYKDPFSTLSKAEENNVFILAMTNLPSYFEQGVSHLRSRARVRQALGFHPLMVSGHINELSSFRENLHATSFIGEIGLDASRDGVASIKQQEKVFYEILRCCGPEKIYSLHSRGAEQATLNALNEAGIKNAIFHWYSGSIRVLELAIQSGFYFSINPSMCRSKKGKEIISRIPFDRILTESDGPFAGASGSPYNPWDVTLVVKYIAGLRSQNELDVQRQVWKNFKRLVPPKTL